MNKTPLNKKNYCSRQCHLRVYELFDKIIFSLHLEKERRVLSKYIVNTLPKLTVVFGKHARIFLKMKQKASDFT